MGKPALKLFLRMLVHACFFHKHADKTELNLIYRSASFNFQDTEKFGGGNVGKWKFYPVYVSSKPQEFQTAVVRYGQILIKSTAPYFHSASLVV